MSKTNASRATNVNTIYTPNGNEVSYVHSFNQTLTNAERVNMHNQVKQTYNLSDSNLIDQATYSYNCHSYAWYNQLVSSNNIWLNYPDSYIEDFSYNKASTVQENYILCYINKGFYNKDTVFDSYGEYISHSAIIQNVGSGFDINNIENTFHELDVISKWGAYGLYTHSAENCPYVEGDFVRVEIYKPNYHMSDTITASYTSGNYAKIINNEDVFNSYMLIEINSRTNRYYDIEISGSSSLTVKFYDANMQRVLYDPVQVADSYYKYNLNFNNKTYYIRVNLTSSSESGSISIIINYHASHNFSYQSINDQYHILTCPCGVTSGSQSLHIADISGSSGLYKPCIYCGHLIPSSGSGIFPGIITSVGF